MHRAPVMYWHFFSFWCRACVVCSVSPASTLVDVYYSFYLHALLWLSVFNKHTGLCHHSVPTGLSDFVKAFWFTLTIASWKERWNLIFGPSCSPPQPHIRKKKKKVLKWRSCVPLTAPKLCISSWYGHILYNQISSRVRTAILCWKGKSRACFYGGLLVLFVFLKIFW